jgi:hypothetical protein
MTNDDEMIARLWAELQSADRNVQLAELARDRARQRFNGALGATDNSQKDRDNG